MLRLTLPVSTTVSASVVELANESDGVDHFGMCCLPRTAFPCPFGGARRWQVACRQRHRQMNRREQPRPHPGRAFSASRSSETSADCMLGGCTGAPWSMSGAVMSWMKGAPTKVLLQIHSRYVPKCLPAVIPGPSVLPDRRPGTTVRRRTRSPSHPRPVGTSFLRTTPFSAQQLLGSAAKALACGVKHLNQERRCCPAVGPRLRA